MRILAVKVMTRLRLYWSLIKSLQTILLLITGLAGYLSVGHFERSVVAGLIGSMFLAISGSTILNMWYDRDIDAKMNRTCWRPLPSGKIPPWEGLALGLIISAAGIYWAMAMNVLYGIAVFAGLFFDVIIYTVWLKRRTAWAIVWGGISGGMPVLAGRVLGAGGLDWVGVTLGLAVLFWIPTHIMTFSMRYYDDYETAGLPTFPTRYGFRATRRIISFSSSIAALAMAVAAYEIGLQAGLVYLLYVLSGLLIFLAATSAFRPSQKLNFGLFKYASMYMLSAMLLISMRALW